ncbi:VOC family protein [Paenibacillus validus]|uniref:Catechol 2,3-dioxygenase n=1 Tax=Paenibacillus validus TaxID=44253 RepID=A0A7X2Z944_9BACL|nr:MULTISPECIES: VOC family protein [Paenibacillus]MED4600633.1 VOC family protein [Paenibacillus validus]MED4606266.1 VOC family protein [Paenibacillus validus]MUG69908.1 catechol 2,3-dioxygenase [Paenibacillus validus]
MGIFKFANASIRVNDLGQSLEFYRDIIGLHEIATDNNTIYLGCGADKTYDIAIQQGGTGLSRFALQVKSDDDFSYFEKKLSAIGVSSERVSDPEPGKKAALRFTSPSNHQIELVIVEDRPKYIHPTVNHLGSRGLGLLDADHITVNTQDVKGFVEFLKAGLDFSISDVFEPAPGVWAAAWSHASDYHHDVAVIGTPDHTTMHHYAFQVNGMEDMKRAADLLAQAGYSIEVGPGRHRVGGNLFTYFLDPSGNRIELSAEMPRADHEISHKVWDNFPFAYSAWGQFPTESFGKGS